MINVRLLLLLLLTCLGYCSAYAQQSPVEYNNSIVREIDPVQSASALYLDAATHGRNAADANAKLAAMVKAIDLARNHVAAIAPYKGYTALRDSVVRYLNLGYTAASGFSGVLSEQDMLALPYEKAKTYMETSDILNDKLTMVNKRIKKEQARFAEKNGFSIETEPKPLDEKLQEVKRVFAYYHSVFLVFFKCNKQEINFVDTLNDGNPKSLEQIRSILQRYTEEGLRRIDTFHAYHNDASLLTASKEALQFYETEAKTKFPLIIDYFQKKDKYDRQSAALKNIEPKDRTDKMIESYKANAKALNDAVEIYNSTNQELNTTRVAVVGKYNKALADFLDRNAPRMTK